MKKTITFSFKWFDHEFESMIASKLSKKPNISFFMKTVLSFNKFIVSREVKIAYSRVEITMYY
ncbi:hypothetical protein [Paenibacillus radicis (ex Xue et al. 2023)]|uniref:Uncharacterized protein n=1 Tax=Paenibacillus radicis (ex Xue et al. 2023) TaxID=2972489 RepID=A0ABT1YLJ8_9BACL|nr:hypothetical protein [Paenibacillus radicis (ex Xue et al. 2023)]MCR8632820.1 hypothetical protein [Paenibacillus radicis (ex Xue et al. 2023)]